jgi:hypothetical protein
MAVSALRHYTVELPDLRVGECVTLARLVRYEQTLNPL